jgi:hypothetical protein
VVAVVCGLAYYIGLGHEWDRYAFFMQDANGHNTDIIFGLGSLDSPGGRIEFEESDYMLADVSIWITYLAFALAAFSAVFSWIWGIFKS